MRLVGAVFSLLFYVAAPSLGHSQQNIADRFYRDALTVNRDDIGVPIITFSPQGCPEKKVHLLVTDPRRQEILGIIFEDGLHLAIDAKSRKVPPSFFKEAVGLCLTSSLNSASRAYFIIGESENGTLPGIWALETRAGNRLTEAFRGK